MTPATEAEDVDAIAIVRPRTRLQCVGVPRPCPFATCAFSLVPEHVAAGIAEEVDGVPADCSCVLDVIESRGEVSLAQIGDLTGLAASGVYSLIARAIRTIERRPVARKALADFVADERRSPARAEIVMDEDLASCPIAGGDADETEGVDEFQDEGTRAGRFLDEDEGAALATVWRIYERASRERTETPCTDTTHEGVVVGGPKT